MELGKPLQTLMVNEVTSRYSNKIGINYPQNYNEIDFCGVFFSKFTQNYYFIATLYIYNLVVLVHVYTI